MLIAKDNDFQSCLMAPTEILATQHYQSIRDALGDMDIKVPLDWLGKRCRTQNHFRILGQRLVAPAHRHPCGYRRESTLPQLGPRHYRRATPLWGGTACKTLEKESATATCVGHDRNAHSAHPCYECLWRFRHLGHR